MEKSVFKCGKLRAFFRISHINEKFRRSKKERNGEVEISVLPDLGLFGPKNFVSY